MTLFNPSKMVVIDTNAPLNRVELQAWFTDVLEHLLRRLRQQG
jgi:hypothetical protein